MYRNEAEFIKQGACGRSDAHEGEIYEYQSFGAYIHRCVKLLCNIKPISFIHFTRIHTERCGGWARSLAAPMCVQARVRFFAAETPPRKSYFLLPTLAYSALSPFPLRVRVHLRKSDFSVSLRTQSLSHLSSDKNEFSPLSREDKTERREKRNGSLSTRNRR